MPKPSGEGFLERGLVRASQLALLTSLSKLLRRLLPAKYQGESLMEWYVVTWAASLTGLLITAQALPATLVCIVAGYRIWDLVSYRMNFLLDKSKTRPWTPDKIRRSIIIVSINFYELTAAFASIYLATGGIKKAEGVALGGAVDALYYSMVTMVTLGYGDFTPQTAWMRGLVIVQLWSSIQFVLYLFPAIVGVFSNQKPTGQA